MMECEQSCTDVHGISLRRDNDVTRVTEVTGVRVLISAVCTSDLSDAPHDLHR